MRVKRFAWKKEWWEGIWDTRILISSFCFYWQTPHIPRAGSSDFISVIAFRIPCQPATHTDSTTLVLWTVWGNLCEYVVFLSENTAFVCSNCFCHGPSRLSVTLARFPSGLKMPPMSVHCEVSAGYIPWWQDALLLNCVVLLFPKAQILCRSASIFNQKIPTHPGHAVADTLLATEIRTGWPWAFNKGLVTDSFLNKAWFFSCLTILFDLVRKWPHRIHFKPQGCRRIKINLLKHLSRCQARAGRGERAFTYTYTHSLLTVSLDAYKGNEDFRFNGDFFHVCAP